MLLWLEVVSKVRSLFKAPKEMWRHLLLKGVLLDEGIEVGTLFQGSWWVTPGGVIVPNLNWSLESYVEGGVGAYIRWEIQSLIAG